MKLNKIILSACVLGLFASACGGNSDDSNDLCKDKSCETGSSCKVVIHNDKKEAVCVGNNDIGCLVTDEPTGVCSEDGLSIHDIACAKDADDSSIEYHYPVVIPCDEGKICKKNADNMAECVEKGTSETESKCDKTCETGSSCKVVIHNDKKESVCVADGKTGCNQYLVPPGTCSADGLSINDLACVTDANDSSVQYEIPITIACKDGEKCVKDGTNAPNCVASSAPEPESKCDKTCETGSSCKNVILDGKKESVCVGNSDIGCLVSNDPTGYCSEDGLSIHDIACAKDADDSSIEYSFPVVIPCDEGKICKKNADNMAECVTPTEPEPEIKCETDDPCEEGYICKYVLAEQEKIPACIKESDLCTSMDDEDLACSDDKTQLVTTICMPDADNSEKLYKLFIVDTCEEGKVCGDNEGIPECVKKETEPPVSENSCKASEFEAKCNADGTFESCINGLIVSDTCDTGKKCHVFEGTGIAQCVVDATDSCTVVEMPKKSCLDLAGIATAMVRKCGKTAEGYFWYIDSMQICTSGCNTEMTECR